MSEQAAASSESNPENVAASSTPAEKEDKEECGWCRWMKGGGCKDEFEVRIDSSMEIQHTCQCMFMTCMETIVPI